MSTKSSATRQQHIKTPGNIPGHRRQCISFPSAAFNKLSSYDPVLLGTTDDWILDKRSGRKCERTHSWMDLLKRHSRGEGSGRGKVSERGSIRINRSEDATLSTCLRFEPITPFHWPTDPERFKQILNCQVCVRACFRVCVRVGGRGPTWLIQN